ncbi:MAG: PAS domain S-box protein [Candidatus Kryptoniota bacterium]
MKSVPSEIRVLLVEDSVEIRNRLIRLFRSANLGFEVDAYASNVGIYRKLSESRYDAVLLDYDMAAINPFVIARAALDIDPFLTVMFVSDNYSDTVFSEVISAGFRNYSPLTNVGMKLLPNLLKELVESSARLRTSHEISRASKLKSSQMDILGAIVRKMVETHDLKSVMQQLAEELVKKLDVKVVSLQRYYPEKRGFAVYGIYPKGKLLKFAEMFFGVSLDSFVFPFDPEHCIVDQYTEQRKPWIGSDFADVFGTTMPSQAARMIQKFAGVKSIYNAPFYNKDQLLGGIVVGNARESFTTEELDAFNAIVEISSLLFEYNETSNAYFKESQRLRAVHKTSLSMHRNLNPEEVLSTIQNEVAEIVSADFLAVYMKKENEDKLELKKFTALKGKAKKTAPEVIRIGETIIGRAAADMRTLIANEVSFFEETTSSVRENILCVPMAFGKELLGMLVVGRFNLAEPFDFTDLSVFEIFTSQFALALNNSKLFENIVKSESQYKLLIENVNDPVVLINTKGELIYVNNRFESLTGYKPREIIGKHFSFLVHPDDLALVNQRFSARVVGSEEPGRYEFRIIAKDGDVKFIDYSVTLVREGKRITGLLGVGRDITNEIQSREKIKNQAIKLKEIVDLSAKLLHDDEYENVLQSVIDSARDGISRAEAGVILIYDKDTDTLRASAVFGHPDEMRNKFSLRTTQGWAGEVFTTRVGKIINDATVYPTLSIASEFPLTAQIKSSIAVPLIVDNEPIGVISLDNFSSKHAFNDDDLQFLEGLAYHAALGIRKVQIKAQLAGSEQRYRTIIESSSDLIVLTDRSKTIRFCNKQFAKTFQITAEEVTGKSISDFINDSEFNLLDDVSMEEVKGRRKVVASNIHTKKHFFDVTVERYELGKNDWGYIFFMSDVTESILISEWMEKAYEIGIERAGEDLFEQFASLLAELSDAYLVFIGDYDESKDMASARIVVQGKAILHTAILPHVSELMRNESTAPELLTKYFHLPVTINGHYISEIKAFERVAGILLIATADSEVVSRSKFGILQLIKQRLSLEYEREIKEIEKRELERRLVHSQKMESLGTLAGGVAHDFNNILTAILGYSNLLSNEIKNDDRLLRYVKTIEKSAQRAADLTKQLLGFARKGKVTVKDVNFNTVCIDTAELTKKMLQKNVEVVLNLFHNLPAVEGDESQLTQVVMNLAVNARDAMPDGGRLTFSTRLATYNEIERLKLDNGEKGYVVVEVSDTGIGIAPEVMPRIFEPFFSTKEKGKGTGLGLSMVYGIVHNHEGEIEVESEVGKGTTFRVYLPAKGEEALYEHGEEKKIIHDISLPKTCLIVDDEPDVRELIADFVRMVGLSVVTAKSGREAIEVVEGNENIDIVILDMIMPGLDGAETFHAIRALRPSLPVLISTGYGAEEKVSRILAEVNVSMINKPFTFEELQEKIREYTG